MKRIVFDVPRWHAYLHRDARGLETATERDGPVQKFEDELFDRLRRRHRAAPGEEAGPEAPGVG
jgi:hypothetical protein